MLWFVYVARGLQQTREVAMETARVTYSDRDRSCKFVIFFRFRSIASSNMALFTTTLGWSPRRDPTMHLDGRQPNPTPQTISCLFSAISTSPRIPQETSGSSSHFQFKNLRIEKWELGKWKLGKWKLGFEIGTLQTLKNESWEITSWKWENKSCEFERLRLFKNLFWETFFWKLLFWETCFRTFWTNANKSFPKQVRQHNPPLQNLSEWALKT